MVSSKVDATDDATSSADGEGRWVVLQDRLEEVRAAVPAPLAVRSTADCDLTFWSEDAQFSVTTTQGEVLVGYLVVVREGDALLGVDVAVKKSLRRTGIATAMYDLAEEIMGATFRPCTPHTAHAAAFWASRSHNIAALENMVSTEQLRQIYHAARNADGLEAFTRAANDILPPASPAIAQADLRLHIFESGTKGVGRDTHPDTVLLNWMCDKQATVYWIKGRGIFECNWLKSDMADMPTRGIGATAREAIKAAMEIDAGQ